MIFAALKEKKKPTCTAKFVLILSVHVYQCIYILTVWIEQGQARGPVFQTSGSVAE